MRKLYLSIALLLFPLALAAAAPADEIRGTLRAQVEAWNRGDIDGFMQAYDRSADLRFASGGTVTHGWQTTLERYRKHYPDRAAMGHLTFKLLSVDLLAPDAATVFGEWDLVREKDHPHGLFTLIFRRRPDGWRIVADHTSSAEN